MDNATWTEIWQIRAQVYSFLGNSLLAPMTAQTAAPRLRNGIADQNKADYTCFKAGKPETGPQSL